MKYYTWNIGCQMNRAETSELSLRLDSFGLERVNKATAADIVLLNTCVVRQNAEDKVVGMLGYLKGIKSARPDMRIAVTGCFVDSDINELGKRYPHVNCFFKAGDDTVFDSWLLAEAIKYDNAGAQRTSTSVSSFIPIIQGCNNYCSYCIVPYRRGPERSRPLPAIIDQGKKLIAAGAREIVLLGQNVNAYGKDLEGNVNLATLLTELNQLPNLIRIRFLTNHPKDMSDELIGAMASLDRICHQICLPLQAGDDSILKSMNRHYTVEQYRALVAKIRDIVPDIAISTDIIVGFPGETEEQYRNTRRAVEQIGFDVVHVAAYSPREGTAASKGMTDDVVQDIKIERLHDIEKLQAEILSRRNTLLVGKELPVLVEGRKGEKWYGRTDSDKLVFFVDGSDYTGKIVNIRLESATAWALQGAAAKTSGS
jgi:tRNA-2-methylthio-N6-dimethylallyladenosine synthase